MSFRELRNFCEIMRALGYPRLISMENFLLSKRFWLAHRYDPKAQISDDIEDQKSRVEFIKSVSTLFATKARIKLNPKKLYQADGYACQEILKIATMLYSAYFWQKKEEDDSQFQRLFLNILSLAVEFSLPSRFGNIKELKTNADDINKIGTQLYDLLNKENEVKVSRDKALAFLENLNSFESKEGESYIEKCVRDIISSQEEQISTMSKYIKNLEHDEKILEEKIRKKTMDLERAEKRFQTLTNVKPAYMDEYERLEHELEKMYSIYIDKFRNLEYLEHELDLYNMYELEKFEESRKKLEKWAGYIKKEEIAILTGEKEVDAKEMEKQIQEAAEGAGDSRPESKLDLKKKKEWTNAQKQMMQENGFFGGAKNAFQKNETKQTKQEAPEDDGELEIEAEDDDEEDEGEGEGEEGEEDGLEVEGSDSEHDF